MSMHDKFTTIPYESLDSYNEARKNLIEKDKAHYFENGIKLSEAEIELDKKFWALRKALNSEYCNSNFYPPARYFYKSRDIITKNILYTLLRKMPKGALLHIHTSSTCDPMWIVEEAQKDCNCYVYWGKKVQGFIKGQFRFYNNNEVPPGFIVASSIDKTELYQLLTFNAKDDNDGVDIWGEFGNCFGCVSGFLCYEPMYLKYYTHAFETLIDDGLQYVELRAGLGDGLYDLSGTVYTDQHMVDLLKKAMEAAKQNKGCKDFSVKLIYSGHRSQCEASVMQQLESAFKLMHDNPGFVIGFDLVGEEDLTYNPGTSYKNGQITNICNTKGNSTYYFIKDFLEINELEKRYGCKMPLFFHDGESDWKDDTNLYDAVLLNCKRIGHGFNLFRFPELEKQVREKDINVEVCPLSNQILGYTRDLRIHPAAGYINKGIQCTISSDDPGIFGYDGVTPDYWEVTLAWDLDLKALKKLVVNSMEYSSMEGTIGDKRTEKGAAYEKWEEKWTAFVDEANNTLDNCITFFTVKAKEKWQDAGINIAVGKNYWTVYQSGLWTANPSTGMVDARGNENYIAKEGYVCQYANEGALIAKVGDKIYLADEIFNIPKDATGRLEFVINDDIDGKYGKGFDDNEGEITVGIVSLD